MAMTSQKNVPREEWLAERMKIVVVGAGGRTGRIVVKDALARGHQVVAVTRADGAWEPDDDNLVKARADVRDADALKRALVGADAVISALGVGTSRAATDVYSIGVRNTLRAMQSNGAAKLAVISAVPAGPSAELPILQRRIAVPLLRRIFGFYDDMRRMEAILGEATEVDWISRRPPRLVNRRPRGTYRIHAPAPKGARHHLRRPGYCPSRFA